MTEDRAYACLRIVRERAGDPASPTLALPDGYETLTDGFHEFATPGEYAVFLAGPRGEATVGVEWDEPVAAVVCGDERRPLSRENGAVEATVPVAADGPGGATGTLSLFTHLGDDDLPVRIEHNHPDRAAGHYANRPWVGDYAAAARNFEFAAAEALRDWGIHRETSAGHLHLMGFETSNPLHGDDPPHWHLNYQYDDPERGQHIPHLYMDERGRVTHNWMVYLGYPDRGGVHGAREPARFEDPDGTPRLALDVRPDGGVDLGADPGKWRYTLAPGDAPDPVEAVRVDRDGEPWRRVGCTDDAAAGVLTVEVTDLDAGGTTVERHEYDPLTG